MSDPAIHCRWTDWRGGCADAIVLDSYGCEGERGNNIKPYAARFAPTTRPNCEVWGWHPIRDSLGKRDENWLAKKLVEGEKPTKRMVKTTGISFTPMT